MKASTQVDLERQRLFVRFVGRVTYSQVEEMILSSARQGILGFPLLIDARSVTIDLFPEEVIRFRDLLVELSATSKVGQTAVLIADDLAEQTLHLVSMVTRGICAVRSFADRAAAENWLGWGELTPEPAHS